MTGFGRLLLLAGLVFAAYGGWQAYQRHIERTDRPTVQARIAGCKLRSADRYSFVYRVYGTDNWVQCTFQYQAAGSSHQTTAQVGNMIFTSARLRTYPVPKLTVASMRDWVARHPTGALLELHYNPARPDEISLADADQELRTSDPADYLRFGLLACALSLAFIAAGSRRARSAVAARA